MVRRQGRGLVLRYDSLSITVSIPWRWSMSKHKPNSSTNFLCVNESTAASSSGPTLLQAFDVCDPTKAVDSTIPLLPTKALYDISTGEDGAYISTLASVVANYWGHQQLRPLQAESMLACMRRQDSLTVLPTGAGKSICFQAPALLMSGTAIVVSPLISLMKDQVDNLRKRNIPAAFVNSSLSYSDRREVMNQLSQGELKLLYIAPERLVQEKTLRFLAEQRISFVALDEAHCVSGWGHDFREEYRQLGILKDKLHNIPIHAFTATASPQVRRDITEQLKLRNAQIFVANMDRPNLLYRCIPATDRTTQIISLVKQKRGQPGIIFCLSRRETERLAYDLRQNGFRATAYHAGLEASERKKVQDSFLADRIQIVVATIAFGMGIDKTNVRYIIHSLIPKSLENYLQESGRAGRDGQPAECIVLYRGTDRIKRSCLNDSNNQERHQVNSAEQQAIANFAATPQCRRRILLEAMGQNFPYPNCGACDNCLKHAPECKDSSEITLKILSAIKETGESYGSKRLKEFLRGIISQPMTARPGGSLSAFGVMRQRNAFQVEDWIEQLAAQGLIKFHGAYCIAKITAEGWKVLQGKQPSFTLLDRFDKPSPRQLSQWSPTSEVDREIFTLFQNWIQTQTDPQLPLCASLAWQIARLKPRSLEQLAAIAHLEPYALNDSCKDLIRELEQHCDKRNLQTNLDLDRKYFAALVAETSETETRGPGIARNAARRYFLVFESGRSIEEIASQNGVKPGTIYDYLCDYITERKIADCTTWISTATISRIEAAITLVGMERYRPIFEQLQEEVSYGEIKAVCAARKVRTEHGMLLLESNYAVEGN